MNCFSGGGIVGKDPVGDSRLVAPTPVVRVCPIVFPKPVASLVPKDPAVGARTAPPAPPSSHGSLRKIRVRPLRRSAQLRLQRRVDPERPLAYYGVAAHAVVVLAHRDDVVRVIRARKLAFPIVVLAVVDAYRLIVLGEVAGWVTRARVIRRGTYNEDSMQRLQR